MKKIKSLLANFYYFIKNFSKIQKFKSFERKLAKGILNKDIETAKLLIDIKKLIPTKTKKGVSKFIPFSAASKAKIKAIILANFGMEMKLLNVHISDDLKFT